MTSAPVLRYPDFTRPFQINVDACNVGGGAVLTQIGEAGHPHVVAFWSTVFSGAELNYGTVEKECCALVKAVIHFRPYIFGRPVTVFTDHAPLQWLSSIADPAGRLLRWSLMLSDYDITIKYRKGSENNDADGLSRAHVREVLLCPGVVQGGDPRAECGCPLGTCEGEALFFPPRASTGDRGQSTPPNDSEAPTPPHQVGLELQEAASKEPLPPHGINRHLAGAQGRGGLGRIGPIAHHPGHCDRTAGGTVANGVLCGGAGGGGPESEWKAAAAATPTCGGAVCGG